MDLDLRLRELTPTNDLVKIKEQNQSSILGCHYKEHEFWVPDTLSSERQYQKFVSYEPFLSEKKLPVIIIAPTILGASFVEHFMAIRFCWSGFAAIVADVNRTQQPPTIPNWTYENDNNRRAILAIRTFMNSIESSDVYDKDKINIIGLSLGGITASLLFATEPERIKSAVSIVGGADMPHILTYSKSNKLRELRENRMELTGMKSHSEYENKLNEVIRYDPIDFTGRFNTEKFLLIAAREDVMVPYVDQGKLWNALGKPKYFSTREGHENTIFQISFYYVDMILEFINMRLSNVSASTNLQQNYTK